MAVCRINYGKTERVLDSDVTGSGSVEREIVLDDSDSVLLSLFVNELAAGTLNVRAYTYTRDGEEIEIITFPEITAPTSELVLKKAALSMSNLRIVADYTGDAKFSIYGKGIGVGETSVRLLGSDDAQASQSTVTTTAGILIPSALTDRNSLVLKNNNSSGRVFIGFSLAEADSTIGYPMSPGECLGIDINAGQAVYAVAETVDVDIRILEAGG